MIDRLPHNWDHAAHSRRGEPGSRTAAGFNELAAKEPERALEVAWIRLSGFKETLDAIKARGLRGKLAIMDGSPHDEWAPKISRAHAVEGATETEWDAAVARFREAWGGRANK